MAHGDAREGKWRGKRRMEWVATSLLHTSTASSRLNWPPADLNGLVRFAERPILVSARVPSRFVLSFGTRWKWEVSFAPQPCSDTLGIEGWVGSTDGMKAVKRSPLPQLGIEPWFLGYPAHNIGHCILNVCIFQGVPDSQSVLTRYTPSRAHTSFIDGRHILVDFELPQGRRKYENIRRFSFLLDLQTPVPVAARSKAWVCGRSPAEVLGSNPTGAWISVCRESCVLSGRGLVQRSPTECGASLCVI